MPIDDLTALGDALRAARKEKNLTQEQLADESHVSTKQIADIEKAKRNPSYLILKALAKVVHLSLDSLMYSDLSPDEAGQNEMKLSTPIDIASSAIFTRLGSGSGSASCSGSATGTS